MAYVTIADMTLLFGAKELVQVSDRNNSGLKDDAVIQFALDDASSEADSYLPTVPHQASRALARHVAAIARRYLHADNATDEIRERYDNAVAWLKLASSGRVQYDLSPATPSAASAVSGSPSVASLSLPHEVRLPVNGAALGY